MATAANNWQGDSGTTAATQYHQGDADQMGEGGAQERQHRHARVGGNPRTKTRGGKTSGATAHHNAEATSHRRRGQDIKGASTASSARSTSSLRLSEGKTPEVATYHQLGQLGITVTFHKQGHQHRKQRYITGEGSTSEAEKSTSSARARHRERRHIISEGMVMIKTRSSSTSSTRWRHRRH